MERGLILLITTVVVFLTSGVRGTDDLSLDKSLQVDITRTGCGDTKVCVEMPIGCDPVGGPCLFTSLSGSPLMPPDGTDLSVELSGTSSGYIALGLTADPSVGRTLFLFCAQDPSDRTFFFQTMSRNNVDDSFSSPSTSVTGTRGSVIGDFIQCEFTLPGFNATSIGSSDANTFVVVLATGGTSGRTVDLPVVPSVNVPVTVPIAKPDVSATPATNMTTPATNMTTPATNMITPATNMTTPATNMTTPAPNMTTSGVSSFFTPHALLLLLSVLNTV